MKKKYRIILIVILVINILILLGFVLYYYNKKNNIIDYNVTYSSSKTYELSNMIIPENRFDFEKIYTNMEHCDKLYTKLYTLIKNMPNLYENIRDLDDKALLEYYENHKGIINKVYTINTEDEFQFIANQCRQIYKDGDTTYKTVRFLLDSFEKQNNSLKCDLEIEYNNSVVIKYSINIYNINNKNIEIYFIPIVNGESPKVYGS